MKAIIKILLGMGIVGVALVFVWIAFAIAMMVYGLYLAFSASIILGVLVLLIEPSPFVIGFVMFFMNKNLAQMLMGYLNQ